MVRISTKKPRLGFSLTTVVFLAAALLLMAGCGSQPLVETGAVEAGSFRDHALTQQAEYLRATVAVLSNEEAKAEPARNLGDDPYFSDGLRAVMLLDKTNRPIREVQFFDWEHAPPHSATRRLDLSTPAP